MQAAALEEQHVVLYVDHSWISYLPAILNPIEAILEGSEISDLFGDDLEAIAKPLKNAAQQDGFQESLIAYFWDRKFAKKKSREFIQISICLFLFLSLYRSTSQIAYRYFFGRSKQND